MGVTLTIYWTVHGICLESTFGNEISPASSSGASFSKPSRRGERETRVTGDDRLQEHSQVTTPNVESRHLKPISEKRLVPATVTSVSLSL